MGIMAMTPARSTTPTRAQAMNMLFECAWTAGLHDPDKRRRWIVEMGHCLVMLGCTTDEVARAVSTMLERHPHPSDQTTDQPQPDQETTHAT